MTERHGRACACPLAGAAAAACSRCGPSSLDPLQCQARREGAVGVSAPDRSPRRRRRPSRDSGQRNTSNAWRQQQQQQQQPRHCWAAMPSVEVQCDVGAGLWTEPPQAAPPGLQSRARTCRVHTRALSQRTAHAEPAFAPAIDLALFFVRLAPGVVLSEGNFAGRMRGRCDEVHASASRGVLRTQAC